MSEGSAVGGPAGRTGSDIALEVLAGEGVRHIFGNPGTTELPLVEALANLSGPEIPEYVLALQEATAVGMADGYAQVTGAPAFLNLHTSVGLGNAVGNLVSARANGTPLVVTAGQQDRRHLTADPLLSGDLAGIAAPVSRWTHEVRSLEELPTILRRAFQDAATPPTGPVFVSLPMDVLDEVGEVTVPPASTLDRRVVASSLDELSELLLESAPEGVAIVAGDEVAASGAVESLVSVAVTLGSVVYGSPLHGKAVFPTSHPLWHGPLPPTAEGVREALGEFDRVFVVGGQAFMAYPYTPGSPLPSGVELLHLSPDPTQPARSWPTRLGVTGDPRLSLDALLPRLRASPPEDASAALARARERREALVTKAEDRAEAAYPERPMRSAAAVHALLRALPEDTPVVDEAVTSGAHVRRFHHTSRPGRYFFSRSGGLGWGMPAAAGVSLGLGGEPVVCVIGDGSAMYAPQALWTAANQNLPVLFAVVDNSQYRILKNALRDRAGGGAGDAGGDPPSVGMDIGAPPLDFTALAASMGVPATSVDHPEAVPEAVEAAAAAGGPHLLHLPVAAG